MKIVIVLLLIAVLGALSGAGFRMLRRPAQGRERDPKAMARALALRVGLSVTLFLLVLLAWHFGWLQPHGIHIGKS